jgi:hypothetical protein
MQRFLPDGSPKLSWGAPTSWSVIAVGPVMAEELPWQAGQRRLFAASGAVQLRMYGSSISSPEGNTRVFGLWGSAATTGVSHNNRSRIIEDLRPKE